MASGNGKTSVQLMSPAEVAAYRAGKEAAQVDNVTLLAAKKGKAVVTKAVNAHLKFVVHAVSAHVANCAALTRTIDVTAADDDTDAADAPTEFKTDGAKPSTTNRARS